MPLRFRNLTNSCYKIFIDNSYLNILVVMVFSLNTAGNAYNL